MAVGTVEFINPALVNGKEARVVKKIQVNSFSQLVETALLISKNNNNCNFWIVEYKEV